ncbi:MAG: rhodanese-like domain-containing protein [Acidimicrobiia bacterium]|jgi:rhodanese-related sulfurtransferase
MKTVTALIVLTLTLAACGGTQTAAPTLVDAGAAQELIDTDPELVVLDIRTPEEVATGTLPAADEFVDFYSPRFQAQIGELDRDAAYLVYCRSGNRTREATRIMSDLGFTDVYELDGGILAWVSNGLPLDQG